MAELGLANATGRIVPGFGFSLPADTLARVERVLGLDRGRGRTMLVESFAGRTFRQFNSSMWSRDRAAREWVLPSHSVLCPCCFEGRPGWSVRWRLAWSFACVAHGIVLAGACPACGGALASAKVTGRHFVSSRFPVPPVSVCGSRLPLRQRCGQLLAELPVLELGVGDPALSAQARIDVLLAGPTAELDAPRFFAELRSVVALLLSAGDVDDLLPSSTQVRRRFELHVRRLRSTMSSASTRVLRIRCCWRRRCPQPCASSTLRRGFWRSSCRSRRNGWQGARAR
jgi:hypothetical protein